ncbi:hypothetical protein B8W69_10835 [Mycobacterium vulneris]|uniref:PPE family protein n=1 Tax=Mycolicibacterium vulneris TaxID=547163 RepID=A0A1X2L4D8_9MYCO|nr:PPE family protein [Mycolicibacterium vulneris]OSC28854.1 hypothetical protein B8W69_10835 [Mycolicibacterium vulneris]
MIDFGALPPEINSLRMYAGPGPLSLTAAAVAWDGLAAELHAASSCYRTVIAGLTTQRWMGPSSLAMASAFAPYMAWTAGAAARAAESAGQARLAVEVYEAAFAMTVPPPAVAANRSQLAVLVATNFFGQNAAAIAATEVEYGEMWAQDAAAMYEYAAGSAAACSVTEFNPAPHVTNESGMAQQAAVAKATGISTGQQAGLKGLVESIPSTLQAFSTPTGVGSTSVLGDAASGVFDSGSISNLSNIAGIWMMAAPTPLYAMASVLGIAQSGQSMGLAAGSVGADLGAAAAAGAAEAASGATALGGSGSGVLASMGSASALGPLAVPPAWTSVIPPSPLGGVLSSLPNGAAGGVSAAPPSMLGGVPLRAATNGAGATPGPRYGLIPTVMAQPPAAGYG